MAATSNTTWQVSLAHLLEGIVDQDVPDCPIEFVTTDSREVKPGSLFLATSGIKRHGLEFVQHAFTNGAVAVLFEPAKGVVAPFAPPGKVVLPIKHLSVHIGVIASRFFDEPSVNMKVCGVTGTNGKTTVTHLIASALRLTGQRCGQMGTLGFGLTDPLTQSDLTTPGAVCVQQRLAWLREQRASHVAMEVSSHALDQHRVNSVNFDIAVFTNLSRDHLDYHSDLEAYATAKKRLFERFPITHAVVNADDALGRELISDASKQVPVTVVTSQRENVSSEPSKNKHFLLVSDVQAREDGLSFEVSGTFGTGRIDSPLLGSFNALNITSALGVMLHWGVKFDQALAALGRVKAPAGRMERFGREGDAQFIVDYAHTPDALRNAVAAVREHCRGQLWCLFGCGGDRDRGKRPQMAAAAELADRVIVTNDNPRYEDDDVIVNEVLAGFSDAVSVIVEKDRAAAIALAIDAAKPEDVVLIAGKGHEDYQLVGNQRHQLSDRALIAQLLKAKGGDS